MTEYEWLTCEDPERMCNQTGSFNQRPIVAYNGLFLSPVGRPDGTVAIYLQQSIDEYASLWKRAITPADACNLIREVVGNPFYAILVGEPEMGLTSINLAPGAAKVDWFLPEWLTGDVYYFAANIVKSGDY